MGWVVEHGLPHSALYGGPVDWEPEDRAKLHAYLLEDALRCPMCGTAPWEWDPAQGGSKHAYDAEDLTCMGCYVKESASERDPGEKPTPGTTVQLVPNTAARLEAKRLAHRRTMERERQIRREAAEEAAEIARLEREEAKAGR